MNFVDRNTKQVFTETVLKLRGINVQNAVDLEKFGLVPVTYAYPIIDNGLRTLVPRDSLVEVQGGFVQEFDVVDRPVEEGRRAIKDRIAARRWEVETGGVSIDGVEFRTGIEDRSRLNEVANNAVQAGLASVSFKAGNGWIEVTPDELERIQSQITTFVQAAYTNERDLSDAADGCDNITQLAALNLDAGWPKRELV